MRLQARMFATALACAVPATALTLWLDAHAQRRSAEDTLVAFARAQGRSARSRCEADPASWGGPNGDGDHDAPPGPPPRRDPPPHGGGPPLDERHHGPPPGPPPDGPWGPGGPGGLRPGRPAELYAFDDALKSMNPRAPTISSSLRDAWQGSGVAIADAPLGSEETEVLVKMPWSGPCSVILGRGTMEPGRLRKLLPSSWVWLTPVAAVLGAVLLALLPLVRRVRRLTEEVGRSAQSHYGGAVTVEGRDELTDLARAFDAAGAEIRQQLVERDRRELALREFLANTTHDVMIPLTVLQGHLASLKDRETAEAREPDGALVSAMDEAHYLASILHNLAVVARLDATTMELRRHRVDLGALVGRVLARHRPIARQLEVELDGATPDEATVALAEVTLLEQAVSNLVYNAVRHNHAGGHVAVVLAHEGASFSIRVIDDGPGIPQDQIERLLERGTRGDASRSRSPGQGLGLAIAHRVAAVHDFELRLGPSEYGGLEAEVRGPRAQGPSDAGPRETAAGDA